MSSNVNKQITTCHDDIVAVLKRHEWPQDIKKQVTNGIAIVDRKLTDDNLYLGVIGEFSSGKSTLINAIIEDPLLSTDVLQATTSSSTMIQYSEKLDIIATFFDETCKIFTRDGLTWLDVVKGWLTDNAQAIIPGLKSKKEIRQREQLRIFLNEVTANEDVAKNISNVILKHPSPILQNGIVLVDTPGTNSNNARHTKVARDAIENICDVAMVVIPGNIPLSAELVNFLKIAVGEAVHRCVFICNKSDLLRDKEKSRMESFLVDRIRTEFGVYNPKIFMLSALKALEPESSDSEDYPLLLKKAREQIISLMHEQREIIQLEKIGNILVTMIAPLKETLRERLAEYNKEHKSLIENMIEDVDVAWSQKASSICKSFSEKANSTRRTTISEVKTLIGDAKQEMFDRIDGAENLNELKSITGSLKEITKEMQTKINFVVKTAGNTTETDAVQRIKSYVKEFESAYTRLSTLGGTINVDNKQFAGVKSLDSLSFYIDGTGNSMSIAGNANIFANVATGGGLVGGAVIGQILIPIPVVGAAIGGFLGGWIGSLFGPDLSDVQRDCRNEVSSQLSQCEVDIIKSIDNALCGICDKSVQKIDEISKETFDLYSALTKEMQSRDMKRRHEIEELQKTTNEDVFLLNEHYTKVIELLSELKTR